MIINGGDKDMRMGLNRYLGFLGSLFLWIIIFKIINWIMNWSINNVETKGEKEGL